MGPPHRGHWRVGNGVSVMRVLNRGERAKRHGGSRPQGCGRMVPRLRAEGKQPWAGSGG